jgi:hypothetical protein
VVQLLLGNERFLGEMPTLATTVDGLRLPNPFIIGSGPPGTNLNVINRAFREGWGAVIAKTVSLDASKVVNVSRATPSCTPATAKSSAGKTSSSSATGPSRFGRMNSRSARTSYPQGVLIASVMEEYRKDAWIEIVERCEAAGVDGFELNFSCPHGLPERKMGAAMGQDPEILEEVCGWVKSAAKKPFLGEDDAEHHAYRGAEPRGLRGGCHRRERHQHDPQCHGRQPGDPAARAHRRGLHDPGRLFPKAVKPIALRMVMEIAT